MGVGLKRNHSAASAQSGASGQFHKRVASQLNSASQSLIKGSTVAHTNATRNTFSGEIHGVSTGQRQMNTVDILQPKRVGTADATARSKPNDLQEGRNLLSVRI